MEATHCKVFSMCLKQTFAQAISVLGNRFSFSGLSVSPALFTSEKNPFAYTMCCRLLLLNTTKRSRYNRASCHLTPKNTFIAR